MSMNPKEKAAVGGGALLLVAMVAIQFVVRPLDKQMEDNRRALNAGQKPLQDLRARSEEYLQLKAEMDAVREKIARHKGESGKPLTVLDGIEKACGFSSGVAMHSDPPTAVVGYSLTRVTIQLEGVTPDQVTGFLTKIQTADAALGVRSLKMTASSKTPGTWTAVVEVVSVAPAG